MSLHMTPKDFGPHGLEWADLESDFLHDGTGRDVLILDADLAAWQKALDALRTAGYGTTFELDGQLAPFPAKAAEVVGSPENPLLNVQVGRVTLNCHFFDESEIEFDLDPRDLQGPKDLDALVGFLRVLASATALDVMLTPENDPDHAILYVDSDDLSVDHTPLNRDDDTSDEDDDDLDDEDD